MPGLDCLQIYLFVAVCHCSVWREYSSKNVMNKTCIDRWPVAQESVAVVALLRRGFKMGLNSRRSKKVLAVG